MKLPEGRAGVKILWSAIPGNRMCHSRVYIAGGKANAFGNNVGAKWLGFGMDSRKLPQRKDPVIRIPGKKQAC